MYISLFHVTNPFITCKLYYHSYNYFDMLCHRPNQTINNFHLLYAPYLHICDIDHFTCVCH